MKSINIREEITIILPNGAKDKNIAGNLILSAIRSPSSPAGITFEQMSTLIDVLKVLKPAIDNKEEEIFLENAQHEVVVRCLKLVPWATVDLDLYAWVEKIINAPHIKVKPSKT